MARTKQTARNSDSDKDTKRKKAEDKTRIMKRLKKEGKTKVRLSDASVGGIKKPHRFRRGTVARRECHKYQSERTADGTRHLVPKTSIGRRIRDKAADYADDIRFQAPALDIIHTSVEALMIDMFSQAARLTALRKMKTVTKDNFAFIIPYYFPDYESDRRNTGAAEESARQRRERNAGGNEAESDD
jgi:histone H3